MNIVMNFDPLKGRMTFETVLLLLEQLRDRHYIVGLKQEKWCVFKDEEDRFRDQPITRKDSFLEAVMSSIAN